MSEEKIIGIDLGTSNSAACIYMDGKPTIIPSAEGVSMYGKSFPSLVAFTENGEILVGEPAKKQEISNPENTIRAIKRFMGEDYTREIFGKKYTPQEISAMILGKIKKDTETFLGEEIKNAVITVPAFFDDNQRTATKDAAKIAGFNVKHLIAEPTAASLAYAINKQSEKHVNILVFDLGGGTLDVTIMEYGLGEFNVKSTSGNTYLGGMDMDSILVKYLADKFKNETGIDISHDDLAVQRLNEAAEKAKIELSGILSTDIIIPFIAMDDENNPLNLITTLNRSKLENLVKPIVNKCGPCIDDALSMANFTKYDIDKVILVGGPTRMPIIQKYVEGYLGKKIERGIDPMECVAQGAAIQGQIKIGAIKQKVNDVTPLSLGTIVKGGKTSVVIKRNSKFPIEHSVTYRTVEDNQKAILIEVVQGEHIMANQNSYLGSFLLDGLKPAKRGEVRIKVIFKIDKDGILNVTARDVSTNKEKSMIMESPNKLSQSKINEAIKRAEQMRNIDEIMEKIADAKNDADSEIYKAKNFLKNNNVTINQKIKIESIISDIKEEINRLNNINFNEIDIDSINFREIKFKVNDLNNALSDFNQYY